MKKQINYTRTYMHGNHLLYKLGGDRTCLYHKYLKGKTKSVPFYQWQIYMYCMHRRGQKEEYLLSRSLYTNPGMGYY